MRDLYLAIFYFTASTVITWWFIKQGAPLYSTSGLMILSCSIAGAKWGIQIGAALLYLNTKKWQFIRRIGFTCFVGSCILLPYCFFAGIRSMDKSFLLSLIAAVITMLVLYYTAVKKTGIGLKWFWGWVFCLSIAVSLQLFVVFKIL